MLSAVYRHRGLDITTDHDLRDIIRSYANQVPRRVFTTPNWDLDIVLKALCAPPYEPLGRSDFRALTKKTIFLISLATAKRIGEMQGISHIIAWMGDNVLLSYMDNFYPKTDRADNPLPREFLLKALSPIVGHLEEERLLCPVRALKYYLARTKEVVPRPRNLFLACKDHRLPMSKNAISFFLRETIKHAHLTQPEATYPRGDVRSHSIRGVATSINFMKNRSFAAVLEAATWRGNSVFVSHYLKDVQRTYEHCSALGPIVSAGGII